MSLFSKVLDKILSSKIDVKYELKFSGIFFIICVVLEVFLALYGNTKNTLIRVVNMLTFGTTEGDIQTFVKQCLLLNPLHLVNMFISIFIFSKFFLIRWLDDTNSFGGPFIYIVFKGTAAWGIVLFSGYVFRELWSIDGHVYGLLPGTSITLLSVFASIWILLTHLPFRRRRRRRRNKRINYSLKTLKP